MSWPEREEIRAAVIRAEKLDTMPERMRPGVWASARLGYKRAGDYLEELGSRLPWYKRPTAWALNVCIRLLRRGRGELEPWGRWGEEPPPSQMVVDLSDYREPPPGFEGPGTGAPS